MSTFRRRIIMMMTGGPKEYIIFADPEVERLCIANYSSDGVGVTMADAASVTTLGAVFRGNTTIEYFNELQYFTGITTINGTVYSNSGAFENCTGLKEVTLSNNVTTINPRAFRACSALVTCDLPTSITSIGQDAFNTCSNLEGELNCPNLTTIGQYAFNGTKISKIVSLGTVSTIPTYTFNNCKYLTEIKGTDYVTKMTGDYNFYSCGSSVDGNIQLSFPRLTSIAGGNTFRGSGIKKILNLGNITAVPGAGQSYGCFSQSTQLTEVSLPSTLTTFGANSFNGCTALTRVNYTPESITAVKGAVFSNCTSLGGEFLFPNVTTFSGGFAYTMVTKIMLGAVTSLGDNVLRYMTSCLTIDLPSTLTSLTQYAIRDCTALTTLIIRATTPPSLGGVNGLNSSRNLAHIYVPYSADHSILNAYKTASRWSTYSAKFAELDANGNIPT